MNICQNVVNPQQCLKKLDFVLREHFFQSKNFFSNILVLINGIKLIWKISTRNY